jgi:hypothetical protein
MIDDDLRIPPPGYRSAPQRRAEEMRRMLLIGGAAALVLLLCVIGYFVVAGGTSDRVPLIQASTKPVKEKPDNPGGLTVSTPSGALPGAGGQNLSLAPPPEKPDPAALAAQATQEQDQSAAARLAPVAKPAVPNVNGTTAATTATAPPTQAPAVAIPAVPETAAPAGRKQSMNVPPPSKEQAKVHNLAQEYAPSAGAGGSVKVQLAALDSKDAAERAWQHLQHRMPGLLAGRHPIFVEATVNGHTYWRVRMAGFRTHSDADKFCQDVRAHGGACAIAAF